MTISPGDSVALKPNPHRYMPCFWGNYRIGRPGTVLENDNGYISVECDGERFSVPSSALEVLGRRVVDASTKEIALKAEIDRLRRKVDRFRAVLLSIGGPLIKVWVKCDDAGEHEGGEG